MYTQCLLLKSVGDVYAADVMFHKNCLNKYLKKFQYDVQALMESKFGDDGPQLEEMFQEVIASMDIEKHGYALSD